MDWQKIKENTKAWEAFFEWQADRYDLSFWEEGEGANITHLENADGYRFNPRDLYDFFDSKGIYISAQHYEESSSTPAMFEWDFGDYSGHAITRTEAESTAFTRAFEILNNQLTLEA